MPTLVSWNGSGFDLPVLHYRMLRHGIASPTYWETGERDRDFKWNNYLNRFHMRHVDLMDVLAAYQGRGRASLEHVSLLLGLPGKLGMGGDQVFDYWKAGRLAEIRAYCETDVLNTYLVWLRFELARGPVSSAAGHAQEIARVRDWLAARAEPHWRQYAAAWAARLTQSAAVETAEIESLDQEGRGVAHARRQGRVRGRGAARRSA